MRHVSCVTCRIRCSSVLPSLSFPAHLSVGFYPLCILSSAKAARLDAGSLSLRLTGGGPTSLSWSPSSKGSFRTSPRASSRCNPAQNKSNPHTQNTSSPHSRRSPAHTQHKSPPDATDLNQPRATAFASHLPQHQPEPQPPDLHPCFTNSKSRQPDVVHAFASILQPSTRSSWRTESC